MFGARSYLGYLCWHLLAKEKKVYPMYVDETKILNCSNPLGGSCATEVGSVTMEWAISKEKHFANLPSNGLCLQGKHPK